jgi:PAS domain S-box-containing protein
MYRFEAAWGAARRMAGARSGTARRAAGTGLTVRAVLEITAHGVNVATTAEADQLVASLAEVLGIRDAVLTTATRRSDRAQGVFAWQLGKGTAARTLYVRTEASPPDTALATALDAFARVLGEALSERGHSPADLAPQLLKAVVENVRTVVVLVWPDGSLSSVAQSFSVVLGYDSTLELPRGILGLVHPEDRATAARLFKAAFARRPLDQPVDLRLRTATGEWVVLETRIRSLLDETPVGAVVFYGQDVTSRRQADRGLRDQRLDLAKVIQTLRAGVVLLDPELNVVVVNSAFATMFDLTENVEALIGRPCREVLARLAGTLPDPELVSLKIEEAKDGLGTTGAEIALLDGSVVELDIMPIGRRSDELGTLLYVRDVTERAAVRTGLERRNRALTEVAAVQSEFVGTVSHELRGPLTSMLTFAEFLDDAEHSALTDEQRQFTDIIRRNGARVLRIVEDLVLLSRLESGTLELSISRVPIPELVRAVAAERQADAEGAKVKLVCEVEAGPHARCDEDRIRHVLLNLIGNSLKFTPPGGTVTLRTAPVQAGWEIEVADTGVGVPESEVHQLFNAFYRPSNVEPGMRSGTGLGLAVSRAIVARHGGTIKAASAEGQGTTITLWLPQRRTTDRGDDL